MIVGALRAAVRQRLAGDAQVSGAVSLYGSEPAIFAAWPVPEDAALPYVVVGGAVSAELAGDKLRRGLDVELDVRCYDRPGVGSAALDALADQVAEVLNRAEVALSVPGWTAIMTVTSGPIALDEDEAQARVVSVRAVLMEG